MRAPVRIEGYAIVSLDGMIANSEGKMPDSLVFEADQRFYARALEGADVVVHGRHSAERPQSSSRRRLIATEQIPGIAAVPSNERALLWNPASVPFEQALAALKISGGAIAILGGTRVFGLFLDRYDAFHLSRAPNVRLPGGRPVFPEVPALSPEQVLANHGLVPGEQQVLDKERALTLTSWRRMAGA